MEGWYIDPGYFNFHLFTMSIFVFVLLRFSYIYYWTGRPFGQSSTRCSLKTLIVLGSGGHTAEMLNLLVVLDMDKFGPRIYVAAETDNMSLEKAGVFENKLMADREKNYSKNSEHPKFMKIYRSREVGQSYVTSIGTTLIAAAHALWIIFKVQPQVVICNGPGTCFPLCLCAYFLKFVGLRWCSIFYVESIARVRRLSLSGLLVYKLHLADQFFVQWPQLYKEYPSAKYVGRLM
ncbi:UDP-N-acetylglucosamine transferase subunit ALG14, related [Zostera marina]|uniref:UDP-N-acetylglucosamine transferase subunit ALG14 n=1 Tax=Zostera marina TaxID=29655 RepID=A0A0K9PRZ2_ZOSMR|nr:UDP-N-acetylglucosamine transferase subunit ALG14, related [Zostera marina]